MRPILSCFVCGFLLRTPLAYAQGPSAPPPPSPKSGSDKPATAQKRDTAKAIQWAKEKGPLLGENLGTFDAFLAARKADLNAGTQAPWKAWLTDLSTAKKPTLRVWALSRLVEAGNLDRIGD